MNFGRTQTEEKLDQLEDTSPQFVHSVGVWALRILFLFTLFIILVGGSFAYGSIRGVVDAAPTIEAVNIMPLGNASFIYDCEGNEIQKLSGSGTNRISISIDEIPLDMQHAIVAIEDSRFYEHNGIDPSGIFRAVFVGISHGFHFSEGASTITQQLLKNNVFVDWMSESRLESVRRKIQEQYLAVKLESTLKENGQNPKDIILENYLNTINLGSGCYGVQTAAQDYFGKDAKDLTLSECAVLAAIPQAPTRYNPKRHPDNNATRREKVLKDMLDQGYITEEQKEEALRDNVYERIAQHSEAVAAEEEGDIYSYFVDEVIHQLIDELMVTKGYTKVQAKNQVYSGGLSIYTTQDSSIQQIMDEEFQKDENFPEGTQVGLDWALSIETAAGETVNYSREMMRSFFRQQDPNFDLLFDNSDYADFYIDLYKQYILKDGDRIIAERKFYSMQPQASMVIMDQETGYVKGIVGGRGEKTASLTFNRATDEINQPGSTFKIVSTYGPAIEEGLVNLNTRIEDNEYSYADGTPLKNADGSYHGNVSVLEAIVHSYNIPAVKTLTNLTPQVGYDYLQKLGFSHLTTTDIIQPLALGGITNGVTTEELTAAYAAIANGGIYYKPIYYTKVIDSEGNVLIDHTHTSGKRVFKTSTCFMLNSAMQQVISRGTGQSAHISGMHVAGKTGTTNDARDLMFAAYTPYYTAAIWGGYDTNNEVESGNREFHKILWQKVMSRIHGVLPDQNFDVPSSIKEVTICAQSGLLPGYNCETTTEYFNISAAPTSHCPGHYVPDPIPTPQIDIPQPEIPTDTPPVDEIVEEIIDTVTTEPAPEPETYQEPAPEAEE